MSLLTLELPLLFEGAAGARVFQSDIATTPEIDGLLREGAPVAIGVSGGKDSCALALALNEHLQKIGHSGPRVLIHSDLGRTEWQDSLPTCERLAAATGLELVVVRRKAGDMLQRWQVRWANNVERYTSLSCVKLILPWSTPAMRFCTSELKIGVICAELIRRFPGQVIVSASGIRAEESSNRAKAPIAKPQPKLGSVTRRTTGLDWHPLLPWSLGDVLEYCRSRGFRLHEAYSRYGSSRVSCCYCILGSGADLLAAAGCEGNHDLYREMVTLEAESCFSFQGDRWLGDVAPHLLPVELRERVGVAKQQAALREAIEARIPEHLLYTRGWPTCRPTWDEAKLLAGVRRQIAALMGWDVKCVIAADVMARYEELLAEKARREGSAA